MKIFKYIIVIALTTYLYGCKELLVALGVAGVAYVAGEDVEDSEVCTHGIEDSYTASVVAAEIASTIRLGIAQLPDGTYNEEVVQCNYYNTMTITGIISTTIDESCGIDCTITYSNRDIIATLSSCDVKYTDYSNFISGEINYSDTYSNQQDSQGVTILRSITISDNGADIIYRPTAAYIGVPCSNSLDEISDTIFSISSYAEGWDAEDQSGSLTSTRGTYFFDPVPAI